MDKDKLEKEGWQFSSISSGDHLKRWLDVYKEMGFDILLEEVDLSKENKEELGCGTECTVCYENPKEPPFRIYIKSKKLSED